MGAFDEFLVSPPTPGPGDMGGINDKVQAGYTPPATIDMSVPVEPTNRTEDQEWSEFISKPASPEVAMSANQTFDYEKSNAERYVQDRHYKELGFNPFEAPVMRNGRVEDANELRYKQAQSIGDVAWKGVVGGSALMWDTAYRQFTQWGDTVNGLADLVSGQGWEKAKRDFVGSDEDLLQANKEQQEIMNKYAIFHSNDEGIFSKEYLFDNIQQFGLGAGQGLEMLAEVAATWGIGAAFRAVRAPAMILKAAQAAEVAAEVAADAERFVPGAVKTAEEAERAAMLRRANGVFTDAERVTAAQQQQMALQLQRGSEMSLNKPFVDALWGTMSKAGHLPIPGSGIIAGIGDVGQAYKAGATGWGAWKGGVGTMAKELSLFNMAVTHGKLLAFTTYGQQYADLMNQYETEHGGQEPMGEDLERIKNNAWMAAGDNFTLNLGLIMAMGKIEWGGLYSKLGSSTRILREAESSALEGAESNVTRVRGNWVKGATRGAGVDAAEFAKTGGNIVGKDLGAITEEEIGTAGQKAYEKQTKMFPAIRTLNMVRKDFGLGTALWEATKVMSKSQLAKFQIAEGLHMVLQNTSDIAFRKYYKNQYNGGTDINGHSLVDAVEGIDWTDEMKKEFANTDPGGGFKTFIMGATNGMFMTPIHHIGNWANTRIMTKINPDAKNAMEYRKAAIDENIKMMNTWYKDPNNVFNAHIDGIKTAGKASQGMTDGVDQQSKYVFHNSKNDLFAKTVSTFIKTGNFDSFLYTLKNMGNMDAKSFYEAFPGMKPSDPTAPLREPRQIIEEVSKDVTDYYTRFQSMKDKFSGYVRPEYFEGRGSEQLKASDKRRAESHQKLTDEYADTKWNEEHDTLSDDEKTANKVKQDEYLNKANRVEEDYLRETSKNRYAQELMRKRVLDESIELMATTDYQAHTAVKRMVDVVSQMSDVNKYPGISSHASQLVNVLGDKAATRTEIYRLNELIKISEGVVSAGTNEASVAKDVKEQVKAQKEQVKHLLAWQLNLEHHQSHDMLEDKEKATLAEGGAALPDRATVVDNLQAAYQGYVNSLNKGIATSPVQIDQPQFNDTLELLYQHMNLAKDFGNYKQALDVLSNPKGFNLLYKKIYDAMRRNTFDMYINQRRALEGYTLHKQVIEQLKKVADEQAKAREEEEKTKRREAASKQAGKLSEHLANIQNDIKALNDEKAEVEKHIKAGEARAGELRGDLQALRDLLEGEDKTKADVQEQFKRMKQSLKDKLRNIQRDREVLIERRDAVEKALDTFTKMKDHYSRALNELESYNKPFEEINPIQSDHVQKVKDLQYTDMNIDGIVEDTKKELEMLNSRIDYFQKVVDTTQKAIQDLIDFVFFSDKGGSLQEKFLEKHRQQAKILKSKFDNYSRDLADAKLQRDRVLQKYGQLSITQVSREALKSMESELHYVQFIQKSLEEQHWEPRPQLQEEEGPQGETAEYFADKPLVSDVHDDTVHEAPEKTEEQIKAETEQKEAITENLLDHFTTPSTEMTAEAKAEFDQFPADAKEQLEAITDSIGAIPEVADDSVQVLRDKAEEIIKKAQDEALPLVSYPQYTDVPYVEKGTNGMWRVMNPNNTYTGQQFGLKADANKVVSERVLQLHPDAKELSPARKAIYEERNAELRKVNDNYKASWKTDNPVPRLSHIHEVNRIEREADRKVLDLTNLSSQEKEIKAIDLFKRRLIDSIEDVTPKDIADAPKKYRIGKYESSNSFSTKQEALDSIDKYVDVLKQDVQKKYTPADERNFEEEQNVQDELFKDSPMLPNDKQSRNDRINYNDINSVSPLYDGDTKSYKKAELKELFSKYTPEEIRDNMTVDVLPNTKAGELSYPIKNNDSVRRRAPKYVYRVSVNGDQAFFLQPNGASYEFDISGKGESQRWITTDSPEFYDDNVFGTNEFARFFNYPPGANVGVTLAKFKADVKKATMLGQVLSAGKITNDQLREKLTFDVRKGLNYSNENQLKGTIKLSSSFADVEASGMEFAGVVIDNGILPNSGKGSRYAGGFGSPAEEAELAGLSPVPTENKGQYTAAFRMTDGTVRWVELSPTTLGETEMNSRLAQVAQILSNVNSNEEIGSTDLNNINKILESVFIATNPYAEGADYFSQKVKLSGRIGIDNNGEAKMTIFLKDTYNMPSAKETAVVGLGKFSEIKDANALLEKINYNLANYGLNHENAPFVRNIVSQKPLDISRFKEQVDSRDIANIKKMDTNVHVDKINGTVVPNSGLTVVPSWSFNVPMEPAALPLLPAKKVKTYSKVEPDANKDDASYNVDRLNDLKTMILTAESLTPSRMEDIFSTLNENEYQAWQETLDVSKITSELGPLLSEARNDIHAHDIVTRYLLPKFIDKLLAEQKNQMENGPERDTVQSLNNRIESLTEEIKDAKYDATWEKNKVEELKEKVQEIKDQPSARTIDMVSKELEDAIAKGDNEKIASLSWELQNTVPTTTPLSEVMEEATDNPTADAIEQSASKAPTAAERKAAREREQAALQAKMKEQQDRNKAPKFLSPSDNFNQVSAENIEKFQAWCAKNLPQDLLSVKDLGVLTDNMRNGRVTVGQFVTYMEGANVKGRIETYKNAPFKYHEAFHGVFRLLLDQKRIDALMREAEREAPISQEDFDAFRAKGYDYKGKEMIERFLEERMADKFDAFKAGRKEPTTLMGKFFRWVSNLWNSLRAKLSGSQLQGLFYEIERGKYRNSKLQDNQFTEGGFVSESMPVSKVIELGVQQLPNGQIVTRSLAQNVADRYSATIAGQVILDLQKGRGDETTILDRILDNYRDTLDPFANEDFYNEIADKNFSDSPEGRADRDKWFSQLDDHFQAFDDATARQQMKESVASQLRNYGLRVNTETDAVEEFIEKTSNTTDNFDRDSFSLGGFGNLNSQVRQFIGSATYQLDHDEFFNTTFKDGTPITQAVHVGKVYNGLLRALGNQADPASALQNLVSFALDTSNSNPETTHFAKYLFEKAGFNYEAFTAGAEVNDCFDGDTGNPTLLNSMIQGFNQQGLNYLFQGFDSNMDVRNSYANTKDSSYYQVKIWGEHFNNIMGRGITDANSQPMVDLHNLFSINKMSTAVITKGQKVGETYVKGTLELSKDIKRLTGIELHPDFLLYSILKNKEARNPDVLDKEQVKFIAAHPVSDVIEPTVLQDIINQLRGPKKDIFSKQGLEGDERSFSESYLNKWATGNANFDEKVNSMNFKSADNKSRYSYIQQNTIGQLVVGMNDPNWQANINDPEFLTDIGGNYLLTNKQYDRLLQQRKLKLLSADGAREMDTLGGDGERDKEKRNSDGVTFGSMNDRELKFYMLGLYNIVGQPDCTIYRGRQEDFYVAPVPIRVNAEKKSLFSVRLPIIDAVTTVRGKSRDFNISSHAMPILYSIVEREVNRIKTVHDQLEALGPDGQVEGHERIEGWNTGDRAKMRGLQLYVAKEWFSDELRKEIEAEAKKETPDLKPFKDQIEREINEHFRNQVKNFAKDMEKDGMIELDEDGQYQNVIAPDYLFSGYGEYKTETVDKDGVSTAVTSFVPNKITDKVYIKNGKFMSNLGQVLMNHFINCTEFNNLLHGDESKMFKNNTDPTKRESSNVGTYNNLRTMFKDESLGIDHSIEVIHGICLGDSESPKQFSGPNGGNVKTDDGMMWMTNKGLRYTLFGTCKLDAFKARLLDNLMSGKLVSETEFFGGRDKGEVIKGLEERGAFNSMKLLFADGRVTLKCSAFTLTPELTSVFNEATGDWDIPMVHRKEAHELRVKMEQFENGNNTIVYAYPKSVSKTLTRNVAETVGDITDSHFEPLDPKFMGNQLENPSNKLSGIEKSQPDWLITSGHADPTLNITTPSGKTGSVQSVIDVFHDAKFNKLRNDWEGAINTLFTAKDGSRIKLGDHIDVSKLDVNIGSFLDHIRENLEMEGTDAQLLGFMETKDGVPVYNINYPGILPKVTANFFTMLSKGVLQGRVPELSLALVSGARGIGSKIKEVKSVWTQKDIDKYSKQGHTKVTQDLLGQPKTWEVITDEQYRYSPDRFKNAKSWTDKNKRTYSNLRAGDFIIDDLRHNFPEFNEVKGKEEIKHYTSEYMRPAHYAEEMHSVQKSLEYSFAVRIPADAKHSFINAKLVDTLPVQLGSVGIFPQELLEIAGPDFDIDKQYVQIADTYKHQRGGVNNRKAVTERVAYGTADTPEGKFHEYVEYMTQTNRAVKDALSAVKTDSLEGKVSDILGADMTLKTAALKAANLPSTMEEFQKAGGDKLNNGVQNNRMLDAKMALLGNREAVKQQDTPTSTDPIKKIISNKEEGQKGFVQMFAPVDGKFNSEYEEFIYNRLTEKNTDINSIPGMVNDRLASKVGVEAIGAVANANKVYALGHEKKLTLRNDDFAITIDGVTYNSFEHSTAIGHPEERIDDSVSSMLNLFADQPKDRDASKLGLDTKSAGFATYEMTHGMTKETALLYMLQPAAVDYIRKIDKLDGELKTKEELDMFKSAQLKTMMKELTDEGAKVIENFKSADLVRNIKEGGTDKDVQLTVLDHIRKMETKAVTFFKVNRILNLIQGHDATVEGFYKVVKDMRELGIIINPTGTIRAMNESEWKELIEGPDAPVVDMRDILMDKKHFISHYIQTVGQLDKLLPAVFLEATPLFRGMMSAVESNLRVPFGTDGETFSRKAKYDLIGYMALRAYMNQLQTKVEAKRGTPADIANLADLTNNLIYANNNENRSIIDIVENLKQKVQDAGVRNQFLDFLYSNANHEKTNGLNRVDTNTWTTLSEQQQQQLIESFVDLYANNYRASDGSVLDTHQAAQSMFNYLLVKDGGQFVNGTFIKFMPPFIFKDFMDVIGNVNDLLSGKSENYDLFGKGVTATALLQDFLKGYATHNANEYQIRRIREDSNSVFPEGVSTQMSNYIKDLDKLTDAQKEVVEGYEGYNKTVTPIDNGIKINMFNGIREVGAAGGKYNAVEKLMRDQNWFYLNRLGFQFAEGKTLQFPYSIRYGKDSQLYTLVNVERRVEGQEHRMGKVSVDQMISEGELIPSGVIATYTMDNLRGSKQQFAAGFVLPNIPLSKDLVGIETEEKSITNKNAAEQRLADFDEKYVAVMNSEGKVDVYERNNPDNPVGVYTNKFEAIKALANGEKAESTEVTTPQQWSPEEWVQNINALYESGMYLFDAGTKGNESKAIDRKSLTPEEFKKKAQDAIAELRKRNISDDAIFDALTCPF